MASSLLFEPLTLRGLTVPGRAWVSPMCQYSCSLESPGVVGDWHLAHLQAFAAGGAPMILTEASAVTAEGRISPWDAGLWGEHQIGPWERIVSLVHATGSRIGIQLAHAGRKGSTYAPFHPESGSVGEDDGGWATVGAGEAPFGAYASPRAMTTEEVAAVPGAFAAAARRAVVAGFDAVELHAAHGYLLAQFLSPLVNERQDGYGGSDQARARLLLESVEAVRQVVPDSMPVLVRVSATDWSPHTPGGVAGDVERTVQVARWLAERGADLVDVSSGGNLPDPQIPVGPGYQTRFAARVREEVDVPVSTVGMITQPRQAELVLATGQADVVMMARALLADPRWWHRAAHQLGHDLPWVPQYARVLDRHVY
ncbi:NADH:flavin oxidoreductase/NADH oxidase [Ornithinimicrobium flavum]|uniref:NADH:flavin oxidoreductase/NADH oxidase n=1 Tax=Ornithinimicrobium flavum TaxID=1288636 RepID=UPI00308405CA